MDLVNIFIWGMVAWFLIGEWRRYKFNKAVANAMDNFVIEMEVEVDGKTFFCYNKATKEFLCQGNTAEEIQTRFNLRFPDIRGAIVSGPKEALDALGQQLNSI